MTFGARFLHRAGWLVVGGGALLCASPVRAELEEDATSVDVAWRAAGAQVARLRPRLYERGGVQPLLVPRKLLDTQSPGCTTLVALATPSNHFTLRFSSPKGPVFRAPDFPESSVAGAVQLRRCGSARRDFENLFVNMHSPRGVVELVAASSDSPLPDLRAILPRRDPGPSVPGSEATPRARPGNLIERLERAEAARRREGSARVSRDSRRAEADGTGAELVRFEAGCHRIDLLGSDPPGAENAADVDLEITSHDGETLAEDPSENSDASVELCLGEPTLTRVVFRGAFPDTTVERLHSFYPLPRGIPVTWGPRARGRLARALREHHLGTLAEFPVYSALGVNGSTRMSLELEPGACYVAVVAIIQGSPDGVALASQIGGELRQNHGGVNGKSTVLAFCSGASDRGGVDVETRGIGLAWIFSVWQLGRRELGGAQR